MFTTVDYYSPFYNFYHTYDYGFTIIASTFWKLDDYLWSSCTVFITLNYCFTTFYYVILLCGTCVKLGATFALCCYLSDPWCSRTMKRTLYKKYMTCVLSEQCQLPRHFLMNYSEWRIRFEYVISTQAVRWSQGAEARLHHRVEQPNWTDRNG